MNKICATIVGKSNAGKSSLINHLCKAYVTSESNKLQTTRINTFHSIKHNNLEILFIDTPGVSVIKRDLLSDFMKKSYIKSLEIADIVIIVFDILSKDFNYELSIFKMCEENNISILLTANKIDLISNNIQLKNKLKEYSDIFNKKIYPISVYTGDGIQDLIEEVSNMKPSPNSKYHKDFTNNHQRKIIIQELIRGVINNNTYDEVPYETAVFIENIEITKKLFKINSKIIVNNLNQKKIIIGKSGDNIKKIGTESRLLVEKIYTRKVHIELLVVINKNWKNDIHLLKKIGFGS